MEFSVNHPILFVIAGIIIAVVLAQSAFFLVRAWKRALELGMSKVRLKKIAASAAIFTIAPAVSILVGVLVLSKKLGIALPWLRLSIIGSLSYETVAAETTLEQLELSQGATISSASDFATVLWVMTLGIIIGLLLVPVLAVILNLFFSKNNTTQRHYSKATKFINQWPNNKLSNRINIAENCSQ